MAFTIVDETLQEHVADRTVRLVVSEGYEQGEYVLDLADDSTLALAVLPMTPNQIRTQREAGAYTTQDVNAYEIGGGLTLTARAEIDYNGNTYYVQHILDYRTEGGFVRYMCKKKISGAQE
jgi:hypothetical protein